MSNDRLKREEEKVAAFETELCTTKAELKAVNESARRLQIENSELLQKVSMKYVETMLYMCCSPLVHETKSKLLWVL